MAYAARAKRSLARRYSSAVEKRRWLDGRGYRIIEIKTAEVEGDVKGMLDRLDSALVGGQTAT